MTDEDETEIERRLRRALVGKADRTVDADSPIPPMAGPGSARFRPRAILPILAAAAVVAVIALGSFYASQRINGLPNQPAVHSQGANPSTVPVPDSTATGTSLPTAVPTTVGPPTSAHHPAPTSSTRTPPPSLAETSTTPRPSSRTSTGPRSDARRSTTSRPSAGTSTNRPSTRATPSIAAAQAGPACTGSTITASLGGDREVGTSGGDMDFIDVVNNGATCTLDGYPSIRILDASGHQISASVTRRSDPVPTKIALAHGDRAQFDVYDQYDDSGTNPNCKGSVYQSMQLTLPGQTTVITIGSYWYSACDLSVTAMHPMTE